MSAASFLLACLPLAFAFPGLPLDKRQLGLQTTPFDAAKQFVSVSGEHKYIAPTSTDSRGPCPALNLMANHGYIPRDGRVSLVQVEEGLYKTLGVAADVASFLALIGVTAADDGTGTGFYIGDFPSTSLGFTGPQVQGLYGMGTLQGPGFAKEICTKYKANNDAALSPAGDPVGSALLGPGMDVLIFRMMSNKSAEYPEGSFTPANMLSFLTTTHNSDGTFTKVPHHEQIPNNWYTRNALDLYDAALLARDFVVVFGYGGYFDGLSSSDEALFANYNMAQLTDGVYTNADMADATLAMCFVSQAAPFVVPALVANSKIPASMASAISSGLSDFVKGTSSLPCTGHTLKSMDLSALNGLLGL